MGPNILDNKTRAGRAAERQPLGKLRDRQIRQATLTQYIKAAGQFYFWAINNFGEMGADWETLNYQAAQCVDTCWGEGEAMGIATDTLGGIQHLLMARRVLHRRRRHLLSGC